MKKLIFISIIFYSNFCFPGHGYQDCVTKCTNNNGCQPSGKVYICHTPGSNGNDQPICVDEHSNHRFDYGVHGNNAIDYPLNGDLPEGYTCSSFVQENVNDLKIQFDPCVDGPNNYKISGDGNSLNLENLANPKVSLNGLHYDASWDLCIKFSISQSNLNSPWPPLFTFNPVLEVDQDIEISSYVEEGDPNYLGDSGLTLKTETFCNPNIFFGVDNYPIFIGSLQPIRNTIEVFGSGHPYPSECKTILHFKETSGGERGLPGTKLTISLQNSAQIIFRDNLTN